jgi:GDP-L-fucose synthase
MINFKNKNILITGGGGMIGQALIELLVQEEANITVADLFPPKNINNIKYESVDLRYFDQCCNICKNKDIIFHLAGIKGSPKMCSEQPANFMVPMLQFNTNMLEAGYKSGAEWMLYTSSVGVYAPAQIFKEDTVWETMPSPNDRFAGWAKRIGELQIEAYNSQYKTNNISIVRPANVYGEFDNFNPENAMVVPSLIRKAFENSVLEVWGDGSPIRDFIYAKDVARGMIFAVQNKITTPLNLGSGKGTTIKELVNTIVESTNKKIEIKWLNNNINKGDDIRLFDMTKANSYGFSAQTSLNDGIKNTIEWFIKNKIDIDKRFNAFAK